METITDEEYRKVLYELEPAVKSVQTRRDTIKRLGNRKREIHNRLYNFVEESLDPSKLGKFHNPWDPGTDKYLYTINFRIPSGESKINDYRDSAGYGTTVEGDIGFFFNIKWENPRVRIKDYERVFSSKDTGPNHIFVYMDYAEELIDKARERMKLTKYREKYDLGPLIDLMHTLMRLRGNKYYIRSGAPPKKYRADVAVDPVTGKETKKRGKSRLNIPFKIRTTVVHRGEKKDG